MSNTVVQYTSETFDDIKADLIAYIKAEHPEWTDTLESDFGVTLVELFSGIGDMMRFYQNVTANESFPSTARLFSSLCRQASWLGYSPHPASAAQVDLTFTKSNSALPATIPVGTRITTTDGEVVFEVTTQLYMPAGQASGTTGAVHGTHVRGQIIGVSDGSKNQNIKLLSQGLVMLTENSNEITVYVGGEEWTEYASLIWAAGQNGYRIWIDSDREAYVRFGDGTYGNIPITGKQIVADYITGGGLAGNVGAHTLTSLSTSIANIASVTNESAASGGAEAETTEELRTNMPSLAITRGRAVTRTDYSRLLEAFGEIAKIDIDHPSTNVVNVYVLPVGGQEPSASLLASARTYLTDIRMITEDVRVLAPTFVLVNVTATLELAEDVGSSEVLAELIANLRTFLDSGEFARELHIHDIYDFFANYSDVEHVTLSLLAKDGESGINDITTVAGEVIVDGEITLTTE